MDTAAESAAIPESAPDGSTVRPLLSVPGAGGLATFTLPAGVTARAMRHRTVTEIWYVVGGVGQLWREPSSIVTLAPGVCATIRPGTAFQFRAATELRIVAVTMPPWPGASEAVAATGPWA
jgi:mannose-6-phosphate isomerase-like protein (cupin superfamily)